MKLYIADYNVLFLVDVLKVFKEITVLPIKRITNLFALELQVK